MRRTGRSLYLLHRAHLTLHLNAGGFYEKSNHNHSIFADVTGFCFVTAQAQGRHRGRTYTKADVDRIIRRV